MRSLVLRIRTRLLYPVLVLFGLAAAAMFLWPGLVTRVADQCGQPALDVRGYWNAADAAAVLEGCGEPGRRAYVHLQLLDLVYPAASGAALVLVTALLLRRYGGRGWFLLIPALVMVGFDYAENVAVWTLLLSWPEVDPVVAAVGGVVTAVKRVAGFVAFSIPIALGLAALVHRGRSTSRSRGSALSDPPRHPLPAAAGHAEGSLESRG